jgi:hypothetical protein
MLRIDPSEADRFAAFVSDKVKSRGLEDTCKSLKSLRVFFNQKVQGLKPERPYGLKVRTSRSGFVFADPLIQYIMSLPNRGESLRRKEAFLRVYQALQLKKISETQLSKFIDNLEKPHECGLMTQVKVLQPKLEESVAKLLAVGLTAQSDEVDCTPLRLMPAVDKRAPILPKNYPELSTSEICKWQLPTVSRTDVRSLEFSRYLTRSADWYPLWLKHSVEFSLCLVGEGPNILPHYPEGIISSKHFFPMGRIGFIQEGGCKLRSVANPFLAVQALGEPLKIKLERLSRTMPTIASFDQDRAKDLITTWLGKGKKVYSFDCSAFTDRFPYAIQRIVLQALLKQGIVDQFDFDVMETVVEGFWVLPDSTPVRWSVGQPLGFGPSFHLATISHDVLLRALGGVSSQYLIVGDDIVINDTPLAEMYEVVMNNLGVEINKSKSILSDYFAEFCGKIISPDGENPSKKTRMWNSAESFTEAIRFYGPSAYAHLSPHEKRWYASVSLPPDLGGLGFDLEDSPVRRREIVDAIDQVKIQTHRVIKDLSDFVGAGLGGYPLDYDRLALFYTLNRLDRLGFESNPLTDVYPMVKTGKLSFDYFQDPSQKERSEPPTKANTFMSTVDTAVRNAIQTGQLPSELLMENTLCRKTLFINPGEKPSDRPNYPSNLEILNESTTKQWFKRKGPNIWSWLRRKDRER